MPRGRPRRSADSALVKSAEFIGWAIGGLEREIVDTRNSLAALTEQAAKLRKQIGRKADRAAETIPARKTNGRRRSRMSAEGRAKIAAAAKRRWAKWRAEHKGK